MTYAIFGVSGNTGKAAAEALLAGGKTVRVVVRDVAKGEPWKARGAEVAVADLSDASQVAAALRGAKGAYLLVPPNPAVDDFAEYQRAIVKVLAEAVTASGIPHVVLLSSVGAQHAEGTGPIAGLYRAEKALEAIPSTSVTFLRAAYFTENLQGSLGMLDQGKLVSFLPAGFPIDMIASHDIGTMAATLLVEGPPKRKQVVELGGPPKSMNDVAESLTRILGRAISVAEMPVQQLAPTLQSFGFKPQLAGLYQEMTAAIASGRVAFEGSAAGVTHRRVLGTTPVETVLRGLLKR